MTSIEFATLYNIEKYSSDIERHLSEIAELLKSMDARLQKLESSMK